MATSENIEEISALPSDSSQKANEAPPRKLKPRTSILQLFDPIFDSNTSCGNVSLSQLNYKVVQEDDSEIYEDCVSEIKNQSECELSITNNGVPNVTSISNSEEMFSINEISLKTAMGTPFEVSNSNTIIEQPKKGANTTVNLLNLTLDQFKCPDLPSPEERDISIENKYFFEEENSKILNNGEIELLEKLVDQMSISCELDSLEPAGVMVNEENSKGENPLNLTFDQVKSTEFSSPIVSAINSSKTQEELTIDKNIAIPEITEVDSSQGPNDTKQQNQEQLLLNNETVIISISKEEDKENKPIEANKSCTEESKIEVINVDIDGDNGGGDNNVNDILLENNENTDVEIGILSHSINEAKLVNNNQLEIRKENVSECTKKKDGKITENEKEVQKSMTDVKNILNSSANNINVTEKIEHQSSPGSKVIETAVKFVNALTLPMFMKSPLKTTEKQSCECPLENKEIEDITLDTNATYDKKTNSEEITNKSEISEIQEMKDKTMECLVIKSSEISEDQPIHDVQTQKIETEVKNTEHENIKNPEEHINLEIEDQKDGTIDNIVIKTPEISGEQPIHEVQTQKIETEAKITEYEKIKNPEEHTNLEIEDQKYGAIDNTVIKKSEISGEQPIHEGQTQKIETEVKNTEYEKIKNSEEHTNLESEDQKDAAIDNIVIKKLDISGEQPIHKIQTEKIETDVKNSEYEKIKNPEEHTNLEIEDQKKIDNIVIKKSEISGERPIHEVQTQNIETEVKNTESEKIKNSEERTNLETQDEQGGSKNEAMENTVIQKLEISYEQSTHESTNQNPELEDRKRGSEIIKKSEEQPNQRSIEMEEVEAEEIKNSEVLEKLNGKEGQTNEKVKSNEIVNDNKQNSVQQTLENTNKGSLNIKLNEEINLLAMDINKNLDSTEVRDAVNVKNNSLNIETQVNANQVEESKGGQVDLTELKKCEISSSMTSVSLEIETKLADFVEEEICKESPVMVKNTTLKIFNEPDRCSQELQHSKELISVYESRIIDLENSLKTKDEVIAEQQSKIVEYDNVLQAYDAKLPEFITNYTNVKKAFDCMLQELNIYKKAFFKLNQKAFEKTNQYKIYSQKLEKQLEEKEEKNRSLKQEIQQISEKQTNIKANEESNINRLNAIIKRYEMKVNSLECSLKLKTKEFEELSSMYDSILQK